MGSRVARLSLLVCAFVVADAFAADPNASEAAAQPPSQPSPAAPPQTDGKSDTGTQTDSTATSPATTKAQAVANEPRKKLLVDDTVNDAQLKQILARGYRPEGQARGNEVSYCRVEHELGTRFDKKVCKTAALILRDELAGKDEASRLERPSGTRSVN